MINAKEISTKRFEKTTIGGYKMEEVDEYLRELALEVAALQKDKDDADKKIDVLADKVRDYMRDEDALKDALLGAQRQGHQVIEDAKMVANKIINEANEQADEILSDTKKQLEIEKKRLAEMQQEVADFKSNLLGLYKEHLDLITSLPEKEYDDDVAPAQEEIVADEAEADVSEAEAEVETPFTKPAAAEHNPNLKFGQNNK
ncbi:MAG: DivIVA domain-containing protein [Ruminococcus sp.]|nr:DivIVA domain-containing protein [Ruminococcus sp.]